MSDKLRKTFPIAISFSDGEMPTSAKLAGLAKQARNSTGVLEYAIGDLWSQSGDAIFGDLEEAQTLVPNISRHLGPAKQLNPRLLALELEEYTYPLATVSGLHEFRLPFPPNNINTFVFTGSLSGLDSTPKPSKSGVSATGEWFVNPENGDMFLYDAPAAADTITYAPVGIPGDVDSDAVPNVIPDPYSAGSYEFKSVKIEYVNGSDSSNGYYIYLPPRASLDNSRAVDVSYADNANNYQDAPLATNPVRAFQLDTIEGATGAVGSHYRYNLPPILTDNWSSADVIPGGFMYLYDPVTNSILESVTFNAETAGTPRTWMFVAQGAGLDTYLSSVDGASIYPDANLQVSTHEATYYPAYGLKVIVTGTSIARALSSLMGQFLNHDHASTGSLVSKQVPHSKLGGLFDPKHPNLTIPITASNLPQDDHPQYLHRGGITGYRDKYNNGMMGNLLFLSSYAGADGTYNNLEDTSFGIRWGHPTTGPWLTYDADSSKQLWFFPDSTVSGLALVSAAISPRPLFEIHFPLDGEVATWLRTTNGMLQIGTEEDDPWPSTYLRISSDAGVGTAGDALVRIGNKNAYDEDAPAQNGSIMVNRHFAGPYNDTTVGPYGWSAAGADPSLAVYGPLRSHHIHSMEFTVLDPVSSFATANTFNETEDRGFKTIAGASTADPRYIYMNFTPGGAGTYNGAFAPINLPYQQYGIVNIFLQVHNNSGANSLSSGEVYFTVGRKGSGSSVTLATEVDLYSLFGAMAPDATNEGWVFDVDDTATLITINKSFTSSTETSYGAFVKFRGVGSAGPVSLDIRSCIVLYRIKEF